MKRFISVLCAIFLLTAMMPASVLALNTAGFFNYEPTADGTGIIITGIADGYGAGDYYVPALIADKPVTEVAAGAFKGFSLGSFYLPATVTRIGDSAFEGCDKFSGSVLTRDLTYIGDRAFYGCKCLNASVLPESVTYIGDEAFYGCESISLSVDMNKTTVGSHAFEKSGIVSVVLPDGIVDIPDALFRGYNSLQSVTVPDSVKTVGAEAFANCTSLVMMTLPQGLTSIGDKAFLNCTALNADINCPDAVIGEDAFSNCSFRSYVLPNDMTDIPEYMFSGNKNLIAVTMPEGLTSIGSYAFSGCTALVLNSLPDSVTTIGEEAFSGCTSLVLPTLPQGLTVIGAKAFAQCPSIGTAVDASGMTVNVNSFEGSGIISYVFPENISSIPSDMFNSCDTLSCVTVPSNIASIGERAFYSCKSLSSVSMAEGLVAIGEQAFYACTALTEVTLPGTLVSLGNSVFARCTALKTLNVSDGIKSISPYCFSNCTSLKDVDLPASLTGIGQYAFAGCTALELIDLPGVASVEGNAFDRCTSLLEVYFGSPSTAFGKQPFNGCTSLSTVSFGKDVKSIDFSALRALEKLSVIDIDSTNTVYRCDEGIVLSKDGKTVLFAPCLLAGTFTVPARVETIAAGAFENTAIRSLSIPSSVKTVGARAFYNCTALTSASVPKTVESIGEYAFGFSDNNNVPAVNSAFTLKCNKATAAYSYAVENGIAVQLLTMLFDADCDGSISTSDARLTLRAAAQLTLLDSSEKKAADIDADGVITTEDARYILRKSAHLPVVECVTYTTAPANTAATLGFYKYAVNKIRIGSEADYFRKSWAEIKNVKVEGMGASTAEDLIGSFLPAQSEAEATEQHIMQDGDVGDTIPACRLTAADDIKLALCWELENGNYAVAIYLNDESNPTSKTSVIGKIANITYAEDIRSSLGNGFSISKLNVAYGNFVLLAEITKDGKFVSRTVKYDDSLDMEVSAYLGVKVSVSFTAACTDSEYGFNYGA